jgi:hypothetical protein
MIGRLTAPVVVIGLGETGFQEKAFVRAEQFPFREEVIAGGGVDCGIDAKGDYTCRAVRSEEGGWLLHKGDDRFDFRDRL